MADEDLLVAISDFDTTCSAMEEAQLKLNRAKLDHDKLVDRHNRLALELKKRCGSCIPKRFLRAASGNVYEITADLVTKVEIQGDK